MTHYWMNDETAQINVMKPFRCDPHAQWVGSGYARLTTNDLWNALPYAHKNMDWIHCGAWFDYYGLLIELAVHHYNTGHWEVRYLGRVGH